MSIPLFPDLAALQEAALLERDPYRLRSNSSNMCAASFICVTASIESPNNFTFPAHRANRSIDRLRLQGQEVLESSQPDNSLPSRTSQSEARPPENANPNSFSNMEGERSNKAEEQILVRYLINSQRIRRVDINSSKQSKAGAAAGSVLTSLPPRVRRDNLLAGTPHDRLIL